MEGLIILKRLITTKQEKIFRACHHNFDGLTQIEAAKKLNIPQQVVSDVLKCIEKILPQMFPILTKIEAERYHLYMIEGWSVDEIAEHFNLPPRSIYYALHRARDKGMYFTEAKGRVLSYDENMDTQIKQQF